MNPTDASLKPLIRKALRLSFIVGIFMAMAGIGAYLALTLIIKGEEPVVVPQLVGKDVLYCLEVLSDLGLNTRVKGTVYHIDIPKNHVIDQDPEAGATIKRGRDVKIRVSRGPETIIMPNLAGLSLQQSRILLAENGLCQGVLATMHSSLFSAGQVIAQIPPSGDVVSRSTCADLLVNKGPASSTFRMLDLSGLTLQTALRRLEQIQMAPGRIRIVHDGGASLETIVDQYPLAGYRVARGTRVDLTVNRIPSATGTHMQKHADQVELFRFALEHGFLNKRVQVKMNQRQLSLSLFDDFLAPGQEIWLLIPKSGNPTVFVYVDGQLVKTQIMD